MRVCITRANKDAYSEVFLRNQIDGLSRLTEVYPLYSGWMPEREEDGSLLSPLPFWLLHKVVRRITGKRNNYFSDYGLRRYLRQHRIDLVLANYGIAGTCLLPVCRALEIPLVVHFHGFDVTHRETLKQYGKAYQELFRYGSGFIAVSTEMRSRLIQLGAPAEKVHLNPYGVDLDLFTLCDPAHQPPHFVSLGRFTPKKAPQLVLQSFYRVAQRFPDARLTMIGGDDGLMDSCKSLVRSLSVEDRVRFAGILKSKEIHEIFRRSRAFVQHSVTAEDGDMEGTPVAVLEASTSGLPVVATRHGGIMDAVIHEKTGYLVEEHDVAGMAQYLMRLVEQPELAGELGRNGHAFMKAHYALEEQEKKLFDILQAISDSAHRGDH